MAHAAAVAELGFDAFSPMLPDVILGRSPNISHLVGSATTKGRKRAALHAITLSIRGQYLIATVQLFAKFGIHPFLIVVGKAAPSLLKWRMSALLTL
jgi:hypothetical protein